MPKSKNQDKAREIWTQDEDRALLEIRAEEGIRNQMETPSSRPDDEDDLVLPAHAAHRTLDS